MKVSVIVFIWAYSHQSLYFILKYSINSIPVISKYPKPSISKIQITVNYRPVDASLTSTYPQQLKYARAMPLFCHLISNIFCIECSNLPRWMLISVLLGRESLFYEGSKCYSVVGSLYTIIPYFFSDLTIFHCVHNVLFFYSYENAIHIF